MAEYNLHPVAFPTLDDIHVATLATFGTRRPLRDGELLFTAGTREYKFSSSPVAPWRSWRTRAAT